MRQMARQILAATLVKLSLDINLRSPQIFFCHLLPQSIPNGPDPASALLLSPLQQKQYKPGDSPAFFNDFLANTGRQIRKLAENDIIIQPVGTPVRSSPNPVRPMSSPSHVPLAATLRKRKALAGIDSSPSNTYRYSSRRS